MPPSPDSDVRLVHEYVHSLEVCVDCERVIPCERHDPKELDPNYSGPPVWVCLDCELRRHHGVE